MNYKLNPKSIYGKVLPIALLIALVKFISIFIKTKDGVSVIEFIEFSDVGVIFTGAFFVMGLLLAGTMSDFKESEKIPGEIACNLESIQDWMLLVIRVSSVSSSGVVLDKKLLKSELIFVTDNILEWLKSKNKNSQTVFPLLRRLNEIVYYFAENSCDKEAIKGIQENTNALRKQLTRTYTIARTNFIRSAYILQQSILFIIILLVIVSHFKTDTASVVVSGVLSFVFLYLYFLIKALDDPFDFDGTDTEIDLMPLDRFRNRIESTFIV
ncbi:hypothetical protein [Flavobacterium sp. GT3R68]|uniref:hypothetical protein n=1 Tax=Flavobacterium sp. GT3R68 TaxID=2594437 RepID=UPI000F87E2B2|nr:hypothetical protein [Flavobacterium sp. GT3R68]RTY91307.1 hypothetical protein EKL32_18945 [Flavobacterium sp. GSN2]TRW93933.1 hypothetical protein FNW07_03210 [Flavobacterium sp. GT3R68]